MFIDQTASLSWFNYLQLGEAFFADVDWYKKNAVKFASDRTEAANLLMIVLRQQKNFDIDQTSGRDRLFVADNVR